MILGPGRGVTPEHRTPDEYARGTAHRELRAITPTKS